MAVNITKAYDHENIGISIHGLMDGCGWFCDSVQLELKQEAEQEAQHVAVALELMEKRSRNSTRNSWIRAAM